MRPTRDARGKNRPGRTGAVPGVSVVPAVAWAHPDRGTRGRACRHFGQLVRTLVGAARGPQDVFVAAQNGECTVCVVSGQPIVVAGIRALLAEVADPLRVYTTVSEPVDADIVIYDVFNLATSDDGGSARELTKLVATHPGRVLALSRLLQPGLTARALANGAIAPVSVSADADEIAALVDAAASGELATDPEVVRRYEADLVRVLSADVKLSPRQQTVIARIAAGYTNDEIAADLYITINTLKSAIRTLYSQIGVTNRASAVAWALEHGYGGMSRSPRIK
jgi:NarL family two-component system response regulator LiaR